MAIKSGQFLHEGNGFIIDRIQTGGASSLNIPEEKIYELGNYQSVATVRDTPELSFDMESFDMSTEIEALLTGQNPSNTVSGDMFDLSNSMPMDVVSPFKATGIYDVIRGIAIPYLTLESATYRFGVRESSTQSFTLRGDSIYYVPGTPIFENIPLVDGTTTYSLTNTAIPYAEGGDTLYVLSATVKDPDTYQYRRLVFGADFTSTTTDITVNSDYFDEGFTELHVVYGTLATIEYPQSIHPLATVKPAAIRGRDVDVYVSTGGATPVLARWNGIQNFEVTRSVTLENDEELGNYQFVDSSYDQADVTGSITLNPRDVQDLWSKMAQIANVTETEVIGPFSSVPLEVEVRVTNPDTGDRIKTLSMPTARFMLPNVQGQVQQKQEVTLSFSDDTGVLHVYDGEPTP